MSDYSKTTNFTAKDALLTGDSNKLIKGSEFDTEFDAIVVANATKHDSGDIATEAQAKAESSNVVLMTPLRMATWSDDNGGMVGFIQALTDPGFDTILGWDDTANAVIGFTITAPLQSNGTAIEIATASLTAKGTVEVATQTEVDTGSDTLRSVSPATLAGRASTESLAGVTELATDAETNTGSDTARCITPANLAQATSLLQATASQKGAVELATQAEADAGTDTARVITAATLRGWNRKVVTADQSVTSSTTLVNITGLSGFTITAGKQYAGRAFIPYTQNVGNIKFQFVIDQTPAQAGHIRWQTLGSDVTKIANMSATFTTVQSFTSQTDGNEAVTIIDFTFDAHASVDATLDLQFAQGTSDANATIIRQGAYLELTPLE